MKNKKITIIVMLSVLIMGLSGCGKNQGMQLVNTLTFDVGEAGRLHLDYDAEDIQVLESENSKIAIKEYMNENKKSYYAKTDKRGNELFITEGKRPISGSFDSYIELYIPVGYSGSLNLHSTSGEIKSTLSIDLSGEFSADTTSGIISVSNITAQNISFSTTNGTINGNALEAANNISIKTTNGGTELKSVTGNISYDTTGGSIVITDAVGGGSFNASGDGDISATYSQVTDNLSFFAKNKDINLKFPTESEFVFSATSKNGSIETNFDELLSTANGISFGTVGSSPNLTVEVETRNGDIKVLR